MINIDISKKRLSSTLFLLKKEDIKEIPENWDLDKISLSIFSLKITKTDFVEDYLNIPAKFTAIDPNLTITKHSLSKFFDEKIQLNTIEQTINFKKTELLEALNKLLSSLSISDSDKSFFETKSRVEILKKEIELYEKKQKQSTEKDADSEKKQKEIDQLEDKLKTANAYLSQISEINKRLVTLNTQVDEKHVRYLEGLKEKRVELVVSKLRNARKLIPNDFVKSNGNELDLLVGEGLTILSVIQLLILILALIGIGLKIEIIVFSFLFIMINIISLLYFNKLRFIGQFSDEEADVVKKKFSFETVVGKLESKDVSGVKALALKKALEIEKNNVAQSLDKYMDGQTIADINQQLLTLKNVGNSSYENDTVSFISTADEFYTLKRELNISTIELENLVPSNEPNNPLFKKALSISKLIYLLNFIKSEYSLPIFFINDSDISTEEIIAKFTELNSLTPIYIFDK